MRFNSEMLKVSYRTIILTSGEAEEDLQEPASCLQGNEDENEEEELLRQAIALSLEEAGENSHEVMNNLLVDSEDENEEEELLRQAIALSKENDDKNDNDDLLKQAIALSLED